MGINIYILDRRRVRLSVGGIEHEVGSLRRIWKITELDGERVRELEAMEATARKAPSPPAVMLADVDELPIGPAGVVPIRAHLVLGWDEGRSRVIDMAWEYLPILGYGVRDGKTGSYVLHERREGGLCPVDRKRAVEIGLMDAGGHLVRHGQPVITECRSVRPYISGSGEADCTFDNGRVEKLLFTVEGDELPDPSWFIGKKPMQVERYPPVRAVVTKGAKPPSP